MRPLESFDVMTFDCYGTLIDWENGILSALRPVLDRHSVEIDDHEILTTYAEIESQCQSQSYRPYREILQDVMLRVAERFAFDPSEEEKTTLVDSLPSWQPFVDTCEALKSLQKIFRLGVISNIDNDLFRRTAQWLGVEFSWVITAEQVKRYKPDRRVFEAAYDEMGISKSQWIHVAQSLFHDIGPARSFGLSTVWVNRRFGKEGSGATPLATATPDLEVPDLKTLVSQVSS